MVAKKGTKKAAKKSARKSPVGTPKKERKVKAVHETEVPKPNLPPVPQPDFGWHDAFLSALELNANIVAACQLAGVPRQTFYNHYENYEEFRARADEAKERAIASLEQIAWGRARAQSDTLTIFLLKAHKPGLYNPTLKIDVSQLTDEQLEQLAKG